MYGSVLVDVPSTKFATDDEWLEFLREMQDGRKRCKPGEKAAIKTIDNMIEFAEEVLIARGVGFK